MSEEIWKPVKGYEKYEVSSLGNARSYKKTLKSYKQLKPIERKGYLRIYMSGKFHTLHKIIAEAFLKKPKGKEYVNHLDGVKTNNKVENLQWCNRSENMTHSYEIGLNKTGKEHSQSKALNIFDLEGKYITTLYGAKQWKEFGLDQSSVNACIRGERKHYKGYTFKKTLKDT